VRATAVAAAGSALAVLAAATAAVAAPAAPPEQRVFTSGPRALQPIAPPPAVDRPMRWHVRAQAPRFASGTQRAVVGLSSPADAGALLRDYGVRGIFLDRALQAMQVEGTAERLRALARRVGNDTRLRYVEPLKRSTFMHRRNDWALNTTDSATGRPYEWTFTHVGLDKAFNLGAGSPLILVGIVDSGADAVPDLKGKVAQTLSATGAASGDPIGHGTFVSSIIAANNDDGIGMAGFCGACRLMVFRLDESDDYSIATGIRRLVDEHVRIINLSLGGYDYSTLLADAVSYAVSHGVLLVAATGNDGVPEVTYPAALLQAENGAPSSGLSVGASDGRGVRASFSNFGSRLSLLAPGALSEDCHFGVLGAVPATPGVFDGDCAQPFTDAATGARYAYSQGTSFSAPEVAGIAALVWAAKPSLKSSEVVSVLEQSATRPVGTGWTPESGWGVVNAARALEFVTGRSSADRVTVGRLTSPQPPSAGRLFQVTAPARWSDGVALPSGKVVCNVSVAGKLITVRGQVGAGVTLCQWRVPRLSVTAPMQVIASVSDPEGVTGTSRRAFLVKAVRR
jgi:subtilisin family serine protease